jgi:adenosylcobinamide-GDP ribazoletransferase
LLVVLGLKVATLASVAPPRAAILLLAAHGLGRAAAVLAMRLTPYAPDGAAGKWKPIPRGPRWSEVAVAGLIAAWPLLLSPPSATLLGLASGGVLALVLYWRAQRLIGGHTGDVLGAIEQVFELGFLLGAAALA